MLNKKRGGFLKGINLIVKELDHTEDYKGKR